MCVQYLDEKAIDKILRFRGYGYLAAPIWFIGFEEGLGRMDQRHACQNLIARGNWDAVMDLAVAHAKLHDADGQILLECRHKFTQVWTWMAKIVQAAQAPPLVNGAGGAEPPPWNDIQLAKAYVRDRLGRKNQKIGGTFLTELSPIPTRRNRDRQWRCAFLARRPNLHQLIANRGQKLTELTEKYKPKLIVCYGLGARGKFQELLANQNWEQIAQTRSLRSKNGRYFILPFFGNGHMTCCELRRIQPALSAAWHGNHR